MRAALRKSVSRFVRRNRPLNCAYFLIDDFSMGRRIRRGKIETASGTRHIHGRVEESIRYIDRVYEDYLRYGHIEAFGGVVCEIGPGDNFGVAARILGGGADQVVAIDRFYSRRDEGRQNAVYRRLAESLHLDHLFNGSPRESTLRGLCYIPGMPAEEFFCDRRQRFDYIISRAVMEHLTDPIGALDQMLHCLKPHGAMVHRVDLRDHGMFPYHGPLEFLTIPAFIYRPMTRNSGRPNRVLVDSYRRWFEKVGLAGEITITRLAGVKDEIEPSPWEKVDSVLREQALDAVRRVRSRLSAPYNTMTDEDLAVSGFVLRVHAKS